MLLPLTPLIAMLVSADVTRKLLFCTPTLINPPNGEYTLPSIDSLVYALLNDNTSISAAVPVVFAMFAFAVNIVPATLLDAPNVVHGVLPLTLIIYS